MAAMATTASTRRPDRAAPGPLRRAAAAGALSLALAASPVQAAHFQGELPRSTYFTQFIGKFCWDYDPVEAMHPIGELATDLKWEGAEVRPMHPDSELFLIAFDDEQEHWSRIKRNWHTATCEEMKSAASFAVPLKVDLPSHRYRLRDLIHEKLRPRWWYFFFVNCGMDVTDTRIHYEVHAQNRDWGLQKEASYDHIGMVWVHAVATLCFVLAAVQNRLLTRRRRSALNAPIEEHPYIRLLSLAVGASMASGVLSLAHDMAFFEDGYGKPRIRFLAVFASVVSTCTIYLIALLSSRGWAITTASMPNQNGFFALIALVGGLHALCELHEQTTVDSSTRMYVYQGFVGGVALALKTLLFGWFVSHTRETYEDEEDDKIRRFYRRFGVGLSIWAISVPFVVLLSFVLDPWVRFRWVAGTELASRVAGLCFLTRMLLGPSSPISAENTFFLKGFRDAAYLDLDPMEAYVASKLPA